MWVDLPELLSRNYCVVLGETLRHLRLYRGLDQKQAALKLPNVEHTALCRYERGESKPSLITIVVLARLYDVDPTELLLRVAAMARRTSGACSVNIPPEWQLLAAVVQHDEALSGKASRVREL